MNKIKKYVTIDIIRQSGILVTLFGKMCYFPVPEHILTSFKLIVQNS